MIYMEHIKNKTVAGLPIINIVSSSVFLLFNKYVHCTLETICKKPLLVKHNFQNSEVPFSEELFEDGLVAWPWQAGVAPQSRVLTGVLLPSS